MGIEFSDKSVQASVSQIDKQTQKKLKMAKKDTSDNFTNTNDE